MELEIVQYSDARIKEKSLQFLALKTLELNAESMKPKDIYKFSVPSPWKSCFVRDALYLL